MAIGAAETLADLAKLPQTGVLGMTQKELAERSGRPLKTINEIVQGKAAVLIKAENDSLAVVRSELSQSVLRTPQQLGQLLFTKNSN